MTNYDRIKTFTLEQMAAFLNMVDNGNIKIDDCYDKSCGFCDIETLCKRCFMSWPKRDSKESLELDCIV